MNNADKARITMERRQKIIEFMSVPRGIAETAEAFGISKSCVFSDAQYLSEAGIMQLHSGVQKAHGKNAAKYVCRQVTLKQEGSLCASGIRRDNYPEILQRFLGFTNHAPQNVSRVYHNSLKPARPDPSPLRRISAWTGYNCEVS